MSKPLPKGGTTSARLTCGLCLIGLSFLAYAGYPFIPLLPLRGWGKMAAAALLSGVGWTVFIVGSLLAGREGYPALRRWARKGWQVLARRTGAGREEPEARRRTASPANGRPPGTP